MVGNANHASTSEPISDWRERRAAAGASIAGSRLLHQCARGRRSRSRSDGSEANPGEARAEGLSALSLIRFPTKFTHDLEHDRRGSRRSHDDHTYQGDFLEQYAIVSLCPTGHLLGLPMVGYLAGGLFLLTVLFAIELRAAAPHVASHAKPGAPPPSPPPEAAAA